MRQVQVAAEAARVFVTICNCPEDSAEAWSKVIGAGMWRLLQAEMEDWASVFAQMEKVEAENADKAKYNERNPGEKLMWEARQKVYQQVREMFAARIQAYKERA